MNKNLLLGMIKTKGETCQEVASLIGMSRVSFSKKLNEKEGASFTQPEIKEIKKHLGLNPEQTDSIFFAD